MYACFNGSDEAKGGLFTCQVWVDSSNSSDTALLCKAKCCVKVNLCCILHSPCKGYHMICAFLFVTFFIISGSIHVAADGIISVFVRVEY